MKEKKLLVVVDMQNDFIDGALGTPRARLILPAVRERIAAARAAGETVVFTRDTHGEDYLTTQEGRKLPVPHCVKGTRGWEIAEGLAEDGERIFDKPSFGSVELGTFVRDGGFSAAELVGVCTDICVVSNAILIRAFSPETEVRVRESCCGGTGKEAHDGAISVLRGCQVRIL